MPKSAYGPISQADPIYPYSVQPANLDPDGPWRLIWMLTGEIVGTYPTYAEAEAAATPRHPQVAQEEVR